LPNERVGVRVYYTPGSTSVFQGSQLSYMEELPQS
jgi:hypothetical protein